MSEGPLTGSYVRDIAVSVYDGKMHPVDSNDISFKIAGLKAFKQAFQEADARYFFGREAMVARLLSLLKDSRFLSRPFK